MVVYNSSQEISHFEDFQISVETLQIWPQLAGYLLNVPLDRRPWTPLPIPALPTFLHALPAHPLKVLTLSPGIRIQLFSLKEKLRT